MHIFPKMNQKTKADFPIFPVFFKRTFNKNQQENPGQDYNLPPPLFWVTMITKNLDDLFVGEIDNSYRMALNTPCHHASIKSDKKGY